MFKLTTAWQGGRAALCAGSHNLTYRPLHQHDDTVLGRRDHLLNGPFQQRFAAGAGLPRAGVAATADEVDEEATD
ncbi:hypothetical protein ABZ570_31190 [Micromonospora sp. NPDC007271]|uniref:hypothetical protein n=1 Tax=Micromonospora sp. NPDC007271 TaxID=3154587 RepID=UPI0033C58ABD